MSVLTIKSIQEDWFEPKTPLALNGQPALVFFYIDRSCNCQMTVIHNAEAQIASWKFPEEFGISVLRVDFNRRRDLNKQYGVVRTPTLLLLDSLGQVVWKQDVGLSDVAPLDLMQAQIQTEALFSMEAK
ncbi:MAG: hypothetical protein GYA34_06825 [Chloroflexi bacterium]|nr:hypothetical protein [Chloroflexota bacterium]